MIALPQLMWDTQVHFNLHLINTVTLLSCKRMLFFLWVYIVVWDYGFDTVFILVKLNIDSICYSSHAIISILSRLLFTFYCLVTPALLYTTLR